MNALRKKGWQGASLAIAIGSALVLAGCGSNDGDGGSSSSGDGATIKIGVTAALSGHGASLWTEASKVTKVWADFINDKGGINGHKVEVIVADTKTDPAAGAAAAQDLVQNKKVSAVLSLDSTAESAVAPYLQTAKVPLLGVTFTPAVAENANVFNVTTGVAAFVKGIVEAAKVEGATKFGLLYCKESPACAASAPIYEQFAPTIGLAFTGKLGVAGDAPNYTAPCLSLIEKGTDFIELDTSGAGQARIAADCVAQGYKGLFGGVASTFTPEIYKDIAGSTWIGSLNSFPWWVDAAPVVEYRDAIAKYDPSINYNGSAPSAAWTSLELFAKAMENADDISAAGVSKAMGTIKDETLGGLLAAPVTLDPSKPTVSPACFWAVKYVAGEKAPTVIAEGDAGNGATDGLQSTCLSS